MPTDLEPLEQWDANSGQWEALATLAANIPSKRMQLRNAPVACAHIARSPSDKENNLKFTKLSESELAHC